MKFEDVVRDLLELEDTEGSAARDVESEASSILTAATELSSPLADDTGDPAAFSHERYFQAGKALLGRDQHREAMMAFELAMKSKPQEPLYHSYYGLTLALSRVRGDEALRLCEQATQNCFHPDVYLNLGRVFLMTGKRGQAFGAFRRGLQIDRTHPEILACMSAMGMRRKPVLPFLPRDHAVNKWAGITLARLGLR